MEEKKFETEQMVNMNEQKKPSLFTLKDAITFLLTLAIIVGFFHVIQPVAIVGDSMEGTFQNKDIVLKSTFQYKFTEPKRGDVVIVKSNYDEADHIIKRIIGLPGEEILIEDGEVYVNGKETREDITYENTTTASYGSETYRVPKGCYFVMGDNRQNSADSRVEEIGFIKKENLEGKVFIRVFPLSKIKLIKNIDMFDTSHDTELYSDDNKENN